MTRPRVIHTSNNLCRPSIAAAVHAVLRGCHANAAFLSTATLLLAVPTAFAQTSTATTQSTDVTSLSEVVVTAQRREQTVQDIPYNISVVSPVDIANSGTVNLNDLARIVNGLVTVDQGPGARSYQNDLTLRGLRTDSPGGGSSAQYVPSRSVNTVSTYFGETPIFFPMVLEDIERVEVLRGPQGTLYGSGAEAGTIRVIPKKPDFSAFSAEVSVTGSYTEHANAPNDNVHGTLNIPLSDNLALRVVAGREHLAGFIDAVNLWEVNASGAPIPSVPGNLSSGPVVGPRRDGVNSSNQGFARAALRWKPADTIDIQFDYLHQTTTQAAPQVSSPFWKGGCIDYTAANAAATTPTCAGRPPTAFLTNPGGPYTTGAFTLDPYSDTVDLASIVANIDFGFANLTSATSYSKDSNFSSTNIVASTINLGGINFNYNGFPPYNSYPRTQYIALAPNTDRSFVEELRLTSNGKNTLDYVVGAFYQRETRGGNSSEFIYGLSAYDQSLGQGALPFGDSAGSGTGSNDYADKAIFGELTAHITQAWQVTGGLRFYRDSFSSSSVSYAPLCGSFCSDNQTNPDGLSIVNDSQDIAGHLKKLNTSYDLSPNTKVYATYSEGFRRGGTTGLPVIGPFASLPQYTHFAPDYAKNYEVGLKGTTLESRIRYSLAVYRVDLTNFQFDDYSGSGFATVFNGSSARSQGVESEAQAAVTEHLRLSAGYTFTDAKTTSAITRSDLVPYALIPALGGTGPTDTSPFLEVTKGARLPGVPRNTATLSVDYDVPPAFLGLSDWRLLLHAGAVYRSSAPGNIDPTSLYYWVVPSSAITNARASLSIHEHLGIDLFANNITSNTAYSGASYVQQISHPYQERNVARPRTVGLTISYKF
jgi:iron complex outermembrane recepter protein